MLICYIFLVAYLLIPSGCFASSVWLLVCFYRLVAYLLLPLVPCLLFVSLLFSLLPPSGCLSAFYSLLTCLVACLLLLSASLLAYLLTTCLLSGLSISVTLKLLNMRFCAVAHATWNAGTLACFEQKYRG